MADTESKPNTTPAKAVEEPVQDEQPIVKPEDPAPAADKPPKLLPKQRVPKPQPRPRSRPRQKPHIPPPPLQNPPKRKPRLLLPVRHPQPLPPLKSPPKKQQPAPPQDLYATQQASGHPEIWGVTLQDPSHHVPSQIIFQKYLNANDGDLAKAKDQLTKTPGLTTKATWSKDKFDALGYVTTYRADPSYKDKDDDTSASAKGKGKGKEGSDDPEAKEVFTWNVYGNVKDMDLTFGDRNEFLDWRVGLMELAMQELDIASATKPITAEWDPLQDLPGARLQFFVNVPAIMGWLYAVVKVFVAERTAKKFHPMGNGANMSAEFADSKVPGLGQMLPKEYGGQGEPLAVQGKQTLLD
ncbi:hypothetical protein PG997_010495 [Apiospora hydei]|uniref:Phosphatidylinositol transfer protein SFH5 n=1 Tax=Apiospora hydei TaxID=1337664 RepID=A0ABR1VYB7_9PEZI